MYKVIKVSNRSFTIPKLIRNRLNINPYDNVIIDYDNEKKILIIEKHISTYKCFACEGEGIFKKENRECFVCNGDKRIDKDLFDDIYQLIKKLMFQSKEYELDINLSTEIVEIHNNENLRISNIQIYSTIYDRNVLDRIEDQIRKELIKQNSKFDGDLTYKNIFIISKKFKTNEIRSYIINYLLSIHSKKNRKGVQYYEKQ
ncbi:hypothetical protein [Senegalia massiliensis]|uniref:Uncharacterized protein n=1 Tax=Senegalia massiliensis TaxID=1720316 RepID=A0A845QZ37_9CLOT|nr:hypothetical protein [Senegalia massiliensis]NBI07571.1 hypothetical protein [Senegalia massiliensis]